MTKSIHTLAGWKHGSNRTLILQKRNNTYSYPDKDSLTKAERKRVEALKEKINQPGEDYEREIWDE